MANQTILAINVGAAIGAAYDSVRNRLYFVEYYGSVSMIDLATGVYTVLGNGYSNPEDIVVTSNGNTAYVTERSGTLLKLALPQIVPPIAPLNRDPSMVLVSGMTAPQQLALDEANNVAYTIEYLQGATARLVRIDLVTMSVTTVLSDVREGVGLLIIPPFGGVPGTAYISEQVNGGQVSAVTLPAGTGTGTRQSPPLIQGYQSPFFLHWADASKQRIVLPLRDPANRVITLDLSTNLESIVVDNVDFRPSSALVLPDGRLIVCTDRFVSAYSVASLATPVGLGGGGAMYCPEIAPWASTAGNPQRWYVACDMTGLYRSTDAATGTGTWTLLDTREVQGFARFGVACHPATAGQLLAFQNTQGLKESTRYGDDYSWTTLVPLANMPYARAWPGAPAASTCTIPPAAVLASQRSVPEVTAAAYCPDLPNRVLIGTSSGILYFDQGTLNAVWAYPHDTTQGNYLYPDRILDSQYVNPADVFKFVFVTDPANPGKTIYYAATTCNILKSVDGGVTWALDEQGLPPRSLGQFRPFQVPSIVDPTNSAKLIPNPNYYPSRIRGFAGGPYTAPNNAYSSYVLWASIATLDSDLDTTVTPNVLRAGGVYVFDSAVGSWKCVTNMVAVPPYDPSMATTIPRYEVLAAAGIAGADVVYVSLINNVVAPNVLRGVYANPQPRSYTAQPVSWTGVYSGKQDGTSNVIGGWLDAESPTGLGWGFGGPGRGLAVDPHDKNVVVLSNFGVVHATSNGNGVAPSWQQKYSTPVGTSWRTNGLGVTTTWNYYVHPNSAKTAYHFLCHTDIGLAVSSNSGDTWQLIPRTDRASGDPVPWDNIFELAFEYPVNNAGQHVWAAMSNQHDIPHDTQLGTPLRGGILRSTNDGQTWSRVATTVLTDGPVVSVVYGGPTGSAALYASVWGQGVFQSTNNGDAWVALAAFKDPNNNNMPVINPRAYRLALNAGVLYCLVSGPGNGSGLYQYAAATSSWTCLTTLLAASVVGGATNFYPKDFALRQKTPTLLDLYVCTEGRGGNYGKAFKYDAATQSWLDLVVPFDLTYHDSVQAFAPFFIDAMCYITSTSQGVWVAPVTAVDAATVASPPPSWTEYRILEFLGVQRLVLINGTMYITTYGAGAWRLSGGSVLSFKMASFQGQVVPPVMQPGQRYQVTIRMKNTGPSPWTPGGALPYQLGVQSPQNNNTTWGVQRVPLPAPVPPGATAAFIFMVTAPTTPGPHPFQWGMVHEGVEWFGDLTAPVPVVVASSGCRPILGWILGGFFVLAALGALVTNLLAAH